MLQTCICFGNFQLRTKYAVLTCVQTFGDCGCIDKIALAYATCYVTIQCAQFDSSLHCCSPSQIHIKTIRFLLKVHQKFIQVDVVGTI